jgi:biotin synthase-related radical SAM superfamily protein
MTDTPETDELRDDIWASVYIEGQDFMQMLEHARKMERERDEAREDAGKAKAYKKVLKTTNANLKRERDKLAEVLQSIRSGYGGQMTDPDCGCGDCEFLIRIDEALQSLTPNEL